jgi:hypothetical protein
VAVRIRIPSSAPRKSPVAYAKLLRRVRVPARSGFDVEGEFLKPGTLVDERALRPSPAWPATPLLVECAGIARPGRKGNPSEYLYILWLYDVGRHEWIELARARSATWDWVVDLAPIAARSINGTRTTADLHRVEKRIFNFLQAELDGVPECDRTRVASVVHDALAAAMGGENKAQLRAA